MQIADYNNSNDNDDMFAPTNGIPKGKPNFTIYHWVNRVASKWVNDPAITKEVYAKRSCMLAKELQKVPLLDMFVTGDEYKLDHLPLKVQLAFPTA